MPIEDIRGFVPIDERIATAGQPTEAQVREIAAAGYVVVVNLGLLDPRYCLPDEVGLVASAGMTYRHIPVRFESPVLDDFAAFASAMDGFDALLGAIGNNLYLCAVGP